MIAQASEKPILFSTPMVQAILDGRKSQTRRLVKPQPDEQHFINGCGYSKTGWALWKRGNLPGPIPHDGCTCAPVPCSYQPGDMLYVKENTWVWCEKVQDGLTPTGKPKYRYIPVGQHVVYLADHPTKPEQRLDDNPEHDWRLKIARYMPKWAARIWLTVTDVRVERLQEISEEDAEREGLCAVHGLKGGYHPARERFSDLWDSFNAKRGHGWEQNPWVWVISFERFDQ